MKNADLFRNETDYSGLNVERAVEHLRQALRFRTVSYLDTTRIRYEEFDALHSFLKKSFPAVAEKGKWEKLGYSLLITLPGSDPTLKPALFMAHQDVVPVIPGSEANWRHGPFSGDLEDGYVWGRGAMDIKQMLIAEMEAAEFWLQQGKAPRRTVILAFGEDEETCSGGAHALVAALRARGTELEFVLDEGAGGVSDAGEWGAPNSLICPIGTYEKGYADLRLTVRSAGGHSSNPFRGTSLGKMAQAIAAILQHQPAPFLSESIRESLKLLIPHITEEPMKTWARDPEKYEAEILEWFDRHESFYHLIRTTAAPTMITPGAPAGNVMPQDMSAVVNFRLIPQDTPETLMAAFRKLLDPEVGMEWEQQISASRPSETDRLGFQALKASLERYFDRLIFLPAQNRGATDARNYE